MSQRLIRRNTTPVGTAAGQSLFPLRGAEPEGENGNGESGSGSGSSGNGTGENGTGSEGQNQGNNGEPGQQEGESAEDYKRRMQAADRRAAAAEARVKELEDAALSETQKKDRDLQELQQFREQATATISTLQAKVAFLSANDVTWHNPDVALGQVNLDSIRDDKGEIDKTALKREIARVSKEMPYLVKASTGDSSGGGAGEKNGAPAGQSGGTPGSGNKNGGTGGLSEDELRKRYPALYV